VTPLTVARSKLLQLSLSNKRGEARRGEAKRGSARHGRAQLGTEKTLLRLLLRNRGNVFRSYVLAWSKYATILFIVIN
jgi:hypothetical protein